jgi:hypothetical protein
MIDFMVQVIKYEDALRIIRQLEDASEVAEQEMRSFGYARAEVEGYRHALDDARKRLQYAVFEMKEPKARKKKLNDQV